MSSALCVFSSKPLKGGVINVHLKETWNWHFGPSWVSVMTECYEQKGTRFYQILEFLLC